MVLRQLGQIIYETSVPPGAFVIRNLYNTQDRGDLQVEMVEANGRILTFTVPYASVSDSVRPGNWQYEVAMGSWGKLNMSASTSSYYGESSRVTQLQLGYNNSWRNISYNLSVARANAPCGNADVISSASVMETMTIPVSSAIPKPLSRWVSLCPLMSGSPDLRSRWT